MKKIVSKSKALTVSLLVLLAQAAPLGLAQSDFVHPATVTQNASKFMMLDAAQAGKRLVAVGEHGYILLSDDGGKSFRQAKSVPVSLTLTAVTFTDARNGWAVGHGSTIIYTQDGGETWKQQHRDLQADQPLLTVYFSDANHGWAAGIWSLLLATEDGGATWSRVELPVPANRKRADVNLYKLFGTHEGNLYATGEQGLVLHSADSGKSWSYLTTGYTGSLWAGVSTGKHTLVLGGLRGKVMRSGDGGQTWQQIQSPLRGSVTQIQSDGNQIWAAALDGTVVRSDDDGASWLSVRNGGEPVTALGGVPSQLALFSKSGVVAPQPTAAVNH